jgi:zinc protease
MRCFVEGDLSRIDRIHTTILGEYINLVLRRRLREELGAVYSVHASIKSMQHPEKGCQCTIEFACAPERVEELRTELQEILTLLPTKAFSGEDIANIVHQLERDFETSIKENQGWMAFLTTALSRQEDPRGVMQTPELLRSVTEESLSNYWTQIYDTSRQIELVMLPE